MTNFNSSAAFVVKASAPICAHAALVTGFPNDNLYIITDTCLMQRINCRLHRFKSQGQNATHTYYIRLQFFYLLDKCVRATSMPRSCTTKPAASDILLNIFSYIVQVTGNSSQHYYSDFGTAAAA